MQFIFCIFHQVHFADMSFCLSLFSQLRTCEVVCVCVCVCVCVPVFASLIEIFFRSSWKRTTNEQQTKHRRHSHLLHFQHHLHRHRLFRLRCHLHYQCAFCRRYAIIIITIINNKQHERKMRERKSERTSLHERANKLNQTKPNELDRMCL